MDDSWGHQYGNIWMALRSVEYFLDLLSLVRGAKALETPCSPNLPEPVALGLFFLQIPRIKFTGHRGWVSKRSILFYGAGGRAELQGSRGSCGRGIPLSLKDLAFMSLYWMGGKEGLAWACQAVFLPRCWGSFQFQPHPPSGFPGKGYPLRRKELRENHTSFLDVQPLAWQTKRDLWLRHFLPLAKDKSTYRSRDIPSF